MKYLLLFSFLSSFLLAQTYEEYLRSQEEAFSSYKDARDKEFSSFLNKEWKSYKESQGLSAYEEEKPRRMPVAEKIEEKRVKQKVPVLIKEVKRSNPKVYKKIIIFPESKTLKRLYLSYFGVDLELHYDSSILFTSKGVVSKKSIKQAWDTLAKSEYDSIIKEINDVSEQLKLNGWAKYLLVKSVSSRLFKYENEANLFSWFTLLKMNYDAHIAFTKHKVILLVPVEGKVYNTAYYKLGTKIYYAVDYYAKGKLGSIMTYENSYKGANKSISFSLNHLPRFAVKPIYKNFSFKPSTKTVNLNLAYNENLLHFFQTYPQVSYEDYFKALDSRLLRDSIRDSFIPLIEGKSQSEALDLLLNFVQKAFKYKVDNEQFNRGKVMFSSETIFYPYSDCEDRAIFFTYLVKTLLEIDVIGLKYRDHMATAVQIDEKLKGEYIKVHKSAYILADPTYVNARLGMSMPKYTGVKPYLIDSTGGEK